ncbi:22222_t:CDS:2, partial [Gigaspora rosea]
VDEEDLSTYTEITYIVDIDIKLESIPPSIIKTIILQPPLCIAKVIEILKTMGHPPYVKNTSGLIVNEGINAKTLQYDLEVEINSGGITDIKTSKIMYPNGFDVSVAPEGLKIELLPPRYTDLRITVPKELELNVESINVRITKNMAIEDGDDYDVCSTESQTPLNDVPDGIYVKNNDIYEKDSDIYEKDSDIYEKDSDSYEKDSDIYERDNEVYERDDFQLKHLKSVVTSPKVTVTDQLSQSEDCKSRRKSYNNRGGKFHFKRRKNFAIEILRNDVKNDIRNYVNGFKYEVNNEIRFNVHQTGVMFVLMMLSFYIGKYIGCD